MIEFELYKEQKKPVANEQQANLDYITYIRTIRLIVRRTTRATTKTCNFCLCLYKCTYPI